MTEHELIVTVVNRGFADDVIAAARDAGAFGGTVVNARGAGTPELKKFFGTVIQPERELVMILTEREKRSPIMEAIANACGLATEGRGICISLPVDGAYGIASAPPAAHGVENEEEA